MGAFIFVVLLLTYFTCITNAQFGRSPWLTIMRGDLDLPYRPYGPTYFPRADENIQEITLRRPVNAFISRMPFEDRTISKVLRGAMIGGKIGLLG
uniref:Uncharacterized protein n=1 Tax=Ascaris lumbricoides TaxID=6252 RepID=A0A0M3IKJ3_ASCLU